MKKRNRNERGETDGKEAAYMSVIGKLNSSLTVFLLTECLNCTSFTDMNSRINAIESKVKKISLSFPNTHLNWIIFQALLHPVNNLKTFEEFVTMCMEITLTSAALVLA